MTLLPEWDDRLPWSRTIGGITATEILRGSEDTGLVVAANAPTLCLPRIPSRQVRRHVRTREGCRRGGHVGGYAGGRAGPDR